MDHLFSLTGRNIILYATAWTKTGKQIVTPEILSITDEDIQGLMEVIHGLKGESLDLILHSPGGSIEAAEAFVTYIRTKFSNIRVIIPQAAMSAATMIACSANAIVMGKHSSIGPIDPQFVLQTQLGRQMVPAQSIIDQFDLAKRESQDPKKLGGMDADPEPVRPCSAGSVRQCTEIVTTAGRIMGLPVHVWRKKPEKSQENIQSSCKPQKFQDPRAPY